MAKYRSIDLFAGIGGIRLGFDNAFGKNIETVFVSEWDEFAQKTYKSNFKDDFDIAGDITVINEKDIPSFDICLAGFPCQAFSIAGRHGGFNDDFKGRNRGNLFLDVVRICEHHKPKVIFCENVKGLVMHDKGNTFRVIRKAFQDIGYHVFWKVLNSKDFGVPQNRERIYIVAFRDDLNVGEFVSRSLRKSKSALLISWILLRYLRDIISLMCMLKRYGSIRRDTKLRVMASDTRLETLTVSPVLSCAVEWAEKETSLSITVSIAKCPKHISAGR